MTALGTALAVLALGGHPAAPAAGPFQVNVIGPIVNVTAHWRAYQPAAAFCVLPNVPQYTPGGSGINDTGRDPVCRRSGFARSAKGLVKITVRTPVLCAGCRRLFIDYSKIPAHNASYAHGHVYYHLISDNTTYTVDPIAHSPNTKNFTNDKLIAPSGSPQEQVVGAFDLRAIAYVSDTANFAHTKIQGPYYIGPWYLSRTGRRIHGVYLDLDVAHATHYSSAQQNEISYAAGFNGGRMCPNDADAFYGGCFDAWGYSTSSIDPFAKAKR